MWFLTWDAFAVSHHLNPFYTDLILHPAGINLMWNPARWTQGVVMAPLTLTLGPVFAYNASQVVALALSAWAAYLALVALIGSRLGAFCGGLLYGWSPYMLGHAPIHSDFIFVPIPPLVLLIFHRLAVDPAATPWKWGVALGILGAVQFLAAEEVAATMALLAAIGAGLHLLTRRIGRETFRRCATAVLIAGCLSAILLAVPVGYQFFGRETLHGEFHGYGFYETDLLGFVIPTSTLAAYPAALPSWADRFGGGRAEQTAYLGLPLLLLLGYTAWRWRDRVMVSWSAAMLVIAAVLSMGPLLQAGGRVFQVPLPWLIFQFLPLLGSVLTGRLMLYAYLMAAVLLGYFIGRLPDLAPRPRIAGYLLLAVVAVSLFPSAPLAPYRRTVPAFFTGSGVERIEGETVLVAPFSADPGLIKNPAYEVADPMLWQAASGMRFKTPAGYAWGRGRDGKPLAGPARTRTQDLMTGIGRSGTYPTLCQTDRDQVFADLRNWGVSAVVVGPMGRRAKMVEFFTDLLGSPPDDVGGVSLWSTLPASPPAGAC
ncbi:MAG: hypothetical protein M3024_00865 [Candidatus Dormibacteraeota bacterium]|nr:hypothetical protein [Candidatus Dormibacteraeota bacterium]